MPNDLAMAVVVLLTAVGKGAIAIAVMLCFCGLLRVGESLNICVRHLIFAHDLSEVVILLPITRTGQHQRVVISLPRVVAFLATYIHHHGLGLDDRICPFSYTTFSKWFSWACPILAGVAHSFRLHSFRRGGASALFR
jgi:hypothetical protein